MASLELTTSTTVAIHLEAEEKIVCIAGNLPDVYVGTSNGRILRFRDSSDGGDDLEAVSHTGLKDEQPILQILCLPILHRLLVLVQNNLFDVHSETLAFLGQSPSVTCVALNEDPQTDDPFQIQLVVAVERALVIVEKGEERIRQLRRLAVSSTVRAAAFSRSTVCYATTEAFLIWNVTENAPMHLFPYDSTIARPLVCYVEANEFLVTGMDGVAVFASRHGASSKAPLVWRAGTALQIVYKTPFAYVLTESALYLLNTKTQELVQRLELEGLHTQRLLVNLDGRIFIVDPRGRLSALTSRNWIEHFTTLLSLGQLEEARELLAQQEPETESDSVQLIDAKKRLGFEFLSAKDTENAAALFTDIQIDPLELARLHPDLVSSDKLSDTTSGLEKSELATFLHELFTTWREERIQSGNSTPFDLAVDTTLAKLYILLNLELHYEDWPKPVRLDVDDLSNWLRLRGDKDLERAELLWRYGDRGDASALFAELLNSTARNAAVYESLCSLLQEDGTPHDILRFGKDIAAVDPNRLLALLRPVVGLVDSANSIGWKTSADLFHDPALKLEIIETAMERRPASGELDRDEQRELDTTYAILLIENCSPERRRRLRDLLLSADSLDRTRIHAAFNSRQEFLVETILLDAKQDPEHALSRLTDEVGDLEAAELLASRLGDRCPQLADTLLSGYFSQLNDCSESDPRHAKLLARVTSLLAQLPASAATSKALKRLPPGVKLAPVKTLLTSTVLQQERAREEASLAVSFAGAIHSSMQKNQKTDCKRNTRAVLLEESSLCAVCHRILVSHPPLSVLRTGYVVHTGCVTNPNLCPVTNAYFGSN